MHSRKEIQYAENNNQLPAFAQGNECRFNSPFKRASQSDYLSHVSNLYVMGKAGAKVGLNRGISPDWVLRVICCYIFCSRGQVDILDAWQVTLDAWNAAILEWQGETA